MPSAERSVTVVIPSRGQPERVEALRRAIRSVCEQERVQATALVVLNGSALAPDLAAELQSAAGVRVIARGQADLPAAHRAGREAVDTPWFCSLDDDDVLLPGALARRIEVLEESPDADVVVTNGFLHRDGGNTLHVPANADVAADPLRAMLRRNWLLPGSWLARSARVGPSLYDGMPRHRECTYLALRFASEYHMRWLQEPTVVYHLGSPLAATSSREYLLGQMEGVRSMLSLSLPPWMLRHIRRTIGGDFHAAADRLWRADELGDAWRCHLSSLTQAGGMHYLPFTRHLLGATLRRVIPRFPRAVP